MSGSLGLRGDGCVGGDGFRGFIEKAELSERVVMIRAQNVRLWIIKETCHA